MNKAIRNLKYKGAFGFMLAKIIMFALNIKRGYYKSDRKYLSQRFFNSHGYVLNWERPVTLNEKLQVLKSVYKQDLHQKVSDKFEVREFLKENFGEQHLIPLVLETTDINEIKVENFPNYPVIVKSNHDA
jgi:hypothetical protein